MRIAVSSNIRLAILVVLLFSVAFCRIHLRVQTTIIGYKLAQLKEQEAKLLEERGRLNMEYADLVSEKNLQRLSEVSSDKTKKDIKK